MASSDADKPSLLGFADGPSSQSEAEQGGTPSNGEMAAAEDAMDAMKAGDARAFLRAMRALKDLI